MSVEGFYIYIIYVYIYTFNIFTELPAVSTVQDLRVCVCVCVCEFVCVCVCVCVRSILWILRVNTQADDNNSYTSITKN